MSVAIEFCRRSEIGVVMEFFREHWARDHVLAHSLALQDAQHLDESNDRYNYVLAWSGGELLGILGFIPMSRYDPELRSADVVWLTTWRVRDDAGFAGLGLALHRHLERNVPHRALGTVGNNADAEQIYRGLRYRVGVMDRHALFDAARASFSLASCPQGPPQSTAAIDDKATAHWLAEDEVSRFLTPAYFESRFPRRSATYLVRRYLRHRFYNYRLLGLSGIACARAVVAIRRVEHDGAAALRAVDLSGDDRALMGQRGNLERVLKEERAEYIDLYSHGLAGESIRGAGLVALDPTDKPIVPSYFEPFEARNVSLRFAFRAPTHSQFELFKGDADQDRPNALRRDP